MKPNDWNDYVILADGPKLSHRLNGKKCYEMIGTTLTTGVIAMQLHQSQGKGVMEADFKDLIIRPLNASFTIPDSLAVHKGGTAVIPVRASLRAAGPNTQTASPAFMGIQVPGMFEADGRTLDSVSRSKPLPDR